MNSVVKVFKKISHSIQYKESQKQISAISKEMHCLNI